MKRIKVPKLARYTPDYCEERLLKHENGGWVDWTEVRMLLSILHGFGIIEVKDTDFEVSDVEIEEEILSDDLAKIIADHESEVEELQKYISGQREQIHGQYCKLRKIRNLVKNPEYEVSIHIADKVLAILDGEEDTAKSESEPEQEE